MDKDRIAGAAKQAKGAIKEAAGKVDRGAPPHLVQATLGHSSLTTTSRYLHARPNDSSARYLAV